MRWQGRRQSENVEDRRGMSASGPVIGGGIGAILLALLITFLGGDPSVVFQDSPPGPAPSGGVTAPPSAEDRELREFVGVVLADTEDVWNKLFQERGRQYQEPKLVLFSGRVESACGLASTAVGPFYCPEDGDVYIDLSFYREMKRRFGASGDFAQAYVIAHEVGHHVQRQLGTMERVDAARSRMGKQQANQLSVRLELQADFLAGVWAHHAQRMKNILDREDINEALNAASAIGDDRLQMEAQGYVVPDAFTHGTSEQRTRWFLRGWETGDLRAGDTFNATEL
jgi:predicted metalloprotease